MSVVDRGPEGVAERLRRVAELARRAATGSSSKSVERSPEAVLRRLQRVGELRRLAHRLARTQTARD